MIYTVVFPIVFGIYKFKQLDFSLRILLYDLILGLIRDVGFDYLEGPEAKHLYQILFAIQNVSFIFFAFLIWGQKKHPFKKTTYLFLILTISFIAESIIRKTNRFSYSLIDPAAYLFLAFIGLDCLAFVLKNKKDKKQKNWKAIWLVVFVVSNFHYVLYNILTYFFYNKNNYGFFVNLFVINLTLYTLTNLILTFLFIWHPPKQQYLRHSSL